MASSQHIIYKQLLDTLEEYDITYAILRDNLSSPEPIRDLDLLIDSRQVILFDDCAHQNEFHLVKDSYFNPGKRVYIHAKTGTTYMVDLHLMMVCRGLEFMDATSMLQNRVKREGYYYLAQEDHYLALLFHNVLAKKRIQDKHSPLLRKFSMNGFDVTQLQNKMAPFGLDHVFLQLSENFDRACEDSTYVRKINKSARSTLTKRPANLGRRIGIRLRRVYAFLFGKPKGVVVTFMGPDGTGKSTTIKAVQERLSQVGLNAKIAYMGPWGDSILKLRMLFFWLNPNPYRADYKLYYSGKLDKKPGPLSGIKKWRLNFRSSLYYFFTVIEMWTRWHVRVLPALRLGRIVLADRYIYDMLTGYKNRPMDYQVNIREKICKKYPSPDLGILLDSEPEIIHKRKPQLTLNQLEMSRMLYKHVADKFDFIRLDTSHSVEETLKDFDSHILPVIVSSYSKRRK